MLVTLSGTVMPVRLLQLAKAQSSMPVALSGTVTLLILSLSWKAVSTTAVTPSGMAMQ